MSYYEIVDAMKRPEQQSDHEGVNAMTNTAPQFVDCQNPRNVPQKSSSFLKVLFWGSLIVGTVVLAISILMPPLCASKPQAYRVKCASNLHQIGQAIQLYVADQKTLPDDAVKLIAACDLSPNVFVCPSTQDVESPIINPTLKGHCSYVFLFENQPLDFLNDPDRVIAYEVCAHHQNAGGNVLFSNGYVDWLAKTDIEQLIKQLEAGILPSGANRSTRRR